MRISSVFQVPPDLDAEVDPRYIEEIRREYEFTPTLERIKYLMAHLYCFNQAVVTGDKEKVVEHFAHIMALRDTLIPDTDAVRIIGSFEQYTKTYLLALIWGIEPERTPPEIREVIRREILPTVQIVPVVQLDPRSIAIALGSLLLIL